MEKKLSILKNRSVIKFTGKDVEFFLNNILTFDIKAISFDEVNPSALLSPQGKILFDLLVFRLEKQSKENTTVFVECSNPQKNELIKKLQLYKLRQEVEIEETELIVSVTNQLNEKTNFKKDKRFKDSTLHRAYYFKEELNRKDHINFSDDLDWYYLKKFLNCVPEGEEEIPSNKFFPFEITMLLNEGVSFNKGCFIGQEVIARVKYKGNAKKKYFPFKISESTSIDLMQNSKIKNENNTEIGDVIYQKRINKEIYGFALIKTKFISSKIKSTKFFVNDLSLNLIL